MRSRSTAARRGRESTRSSFDLLRAPRPWTRPEGGRSRALDPAASSMLRAPSGRHRARSWPSLERLLGGVADLMRICFVRNVAIQRVAPLDLGDCCLQLVALG